MKTHLIAIVALAGVALLSVDCGSNDVPATTDPCDAYSTSVASYLVRCSSGDPARESQVAAEIAAGCRAVLALPGVGDTTAVFASCATDYETEDCFARPEPDTCNTAVVVGTLPLNAVCASSEQCASGVCAASGSAGCGLCTVGAAENADCSAAPCEADCYCQTVFMAQGAPTQICKKLSSRSGVGGACLTSDDCVLPNFCQIGQNATGVCAAPLGAGKACDDFDACTAGLLCLGTTCAPLAKLGEDCSDNLCVSPLGCDPSTSKCVATTFVGPGATCDDAVNLCSHGFCGFTNDTDTAGTCPKAVDDGGDCTDSSECEVLSSCNNGFCNEVPPNCK